MKDLLEYLTRGLVEHPDAVRVTEVEEDDGIDRARALGRRGRLRQRDRPRRADREALRTVVKAAAAKEQRRVFVDIVDA